MTPIGEQTAGPADRRCLRPRPPQDVLVSGIGTALFYSAFLPPNSAARGGRWEGVAGSTASPVLTPCSMSTGSTALAFERRERGAGRIWGLASRERYL